jgi:murein DD-endopeptidase MepM/ murein hydrolase activator NlpD
VVGLPFLASFVAVSVSVVAAILPAIAIPGHPGTTGPAFPAPPGYLLPWTGGELHRVSQGEETSLTHNGTAAYAFDFDLAYETVTAARGGKVTMTRQDSNMGGCNPLLSQAANYVVIDHGDGTSGLYLHLAQDSITVRAGDVVEQGQPLAVSGETGLTCSDIGSNPGPHLHFQVERSEAGRYITQSLPVAFDDIPRNEGVPVEGETYISGNYGRGKPQKLKLTPRRVARSFNPVAVPADPALIEALPLTEPTADAGAAPSPIAVPEPEEWLVGGPPEPTNTPRPTRTPTETPTATPAPRPADTPAPLPEPTATLIPPTAAPSDTPTPAAATPTDTATATATSTDTATPPPAP